MKQCCFNCHFFEAVRGPLGECRHDSPDTKFVTDPFYEGETVEWPRTANYKWCGDWILEHKDKNTDESRADWLASISGERE